MAARLRAAASPGGLAPPVLARPSGAQEPAKPGRAASAGGARRWAGGSRARPLGAESAGGEKLIFFWIRKERRSKLKKKLGDRGERFTFASRVNLIPCGSLGARKREVHVCLRSEPIALAVGARRRNFNFFLGARGAGLKIAKKNGGPVALG